MSLTFPLPIAEDVNDMIRRARARREEARQTPAIGGSSSAHRSQPRNPSQELGGIYDFSDETQRVANSGNPSVDPDPRPAKRVKKEEQQ
jgi:hypothetical protein